jgi:enoyl-CoA hydratase/carnithine racemase
MSELLIEERGAIAILTLSNPARRNALDAELLEALARAVGSLPARGVRAAVLTGGGELFSSGYDIRALPDEAAPADNPLARALAAVVEGELPLIAALNGPAVGGGCELAAACDLRVAHPEVTLTMPPVRLGLVYSPSGLRRFVALIGASRTRELFLTAQPVEAARALAWGLVDRVVDRDAVLDSALALADQIARGAPLAVRGTRKLLARLEAPLPEEIEAELEEIVKAAWSSEDAREARAAFREKRPPRFTGR